MVMTGAGPTQLTTELRAKPGEPCPVPSALARLSDHGDGIGPEDRPPESVQTETEGVPRRVEEHPEGRTGLVLMLGRAQIEHRRLGGGDVIDDHVEMRLLRHLLGSAI